MRVLVTGASGFLGRHLLAALARRRCEVVRLTRGPLDPSDPRLLRWDPERGQVDEAALRDLDAVVHLAGQGIADAKWSPAVRQRLRDSRVAATRLLVEAVAAQKRRPAVLLSASAVGYYGDRGNEELSESSLPGDGFLPELCREWESESLAAAGRWGCRVAVLRLGLVLGRDGGVLRRTLLPFRLGLGGRLGSGRQWVSWIALQDAVRAALFLLESPGASGAYNVCSPHPVTNRLYTQSLARAVGRPAVLPAPAFALRLAFGELADALLLASQRTLPIRLREAGFSWDLPYVGEALNHLALSSR